VERSGEGQAALACWLVAGLGNPGLEYAFTPHNLGFMVIDRLAEANGIHVTRKESKALVGHGKIAGQPVTLAKPQTYMNISGVAVRALLERYSLTVRNLILVYDDLALPWMALRVRPKGSAGGHNGVESVIGCVGTNEFARVRLGIHPGHPVSDGAKFVLAPFRRAQSKELDEVLDHGARAVESLIAEGVEKSMTKFNRRAQGSKDEEE
jgi:PTH1 family peptidyl-tRNA hydrolase